MPAAENKIQIKEETILIENNVLFSILLEINPLNPITKHINRGKNRTKFILSTKKFIKSPYLLFFLHQDIHFFDKSYTVLQLQ